MLAALVDQDGGRAAGDVVEPAAGQREALALEVLHRRGEVEPAVEPGLDRVLVGGRHVHQMARLQRADMVGDELVGQRAVARHREQQDEAGRHREPGPERNRRLGAQPRADRRPHWRAARAGVAAAAAMRAGHRRAASRGAGRVRHLLAQAGREVRELGGQRGAVRAGIEVLAHHRAASAGLSSPSASAWMSSCISAQVTWFMTTLSRQQRLTRAPEARHDGADRHPRHLGDLLYDISSNSRSTRHSRNRAGAQQGLVERVQVLAARSAVSGSRPGRKAPTPAALTSSRLVVLSRLREASVS